LLIGAYVVKVVPRARNLGFVLNERLTATDHFRKVCQRTYWILRYLKLHAAHTPFEVRRRLVLWPILPHFNYGNIVFTDARGCIQGLFALHTNEETRLDGLILFHTWNRL
jgi:hypothetical protein